MAHNSLDNPQDQFTLSVELLWLMNWLIENDPEGVKKLIDRAMSQGLAQELTQAHQHQVNSNSLHSTIIDFFILMEALLFESINENSAKSSLARTLIPAVNRIDTSACDSSTVQFSLERATAQMGHNKQANARDILMKELLKRWKPAKKAVLN